MTYKYAIEPVWYEACCTCASDGVLTWCRMCPATWEVRGPYCDGCMGWPTCSCAKKHRGACTSEASPTADEVWAALGLGDDGVLLGEGYATWLEAP